MGESTPHIFCCHQSRSVLLQCILPFTKVPNSGLHLPEDQIDSTLSCISPFSSGFDLLGNLTVAREGPHCSPLTPKVSTSLPKSCQKANTNKEGKERSSLGSAHIRNTRENCLDISTWSMLLMTPAMYL